jgi:hypothetical protein
MFQNAKNAIDRDGRQEQRTRQGDAVEHLGEIALGGWPRTDAGDEATLLADDVGLLLRVERDGRIEVREEDDQERVETDVPPAVVVHEVVVDPLLDADGCCRAPAIQEERQDRARESPGSTDKLTSTGM